MVDMTISLGVGDQEDVKTGGTGAIDDDAWHVAFRAAAFG